MASDDAPEPAPRPHRHGATTDRQPDTEPAPHTDSALDHSWSDDPGSDHRDDHITPDIPVSNADVEAAIELAEAERAVTLNVATAEQADGVARAGRERTPRERRDAWRQRRRTADVAPEASRRAPAGSAGGSTHVGTTAAGPVPEHGGRPHDMVAAAASALRDPRASVAMAAAAALVAVLVARRRRS